ncbi:MAG: enoyl-CoA hydratase/isomerase family protein [Flavobacteriales bacterium]|jgi:2-(1,2-epoxy-1,2-dihydrophenyl)acetyl-CoA isomerase|nr:enoyl-CoA hydratase/isomerase family protein [Flavobacteriales bacterium]MCB0758222.1 enoyl-CoA hydratase/isomerase family protein [Flavobacteriales bacterium]
MNYEQILYTSAEGVATITLNRSEKLNSFTARMSEETLHALKAAQADAAVRAIVITGKGRAFCAGQDLAEATAPGVRIEDVVERQYNAIIRILRQMPKPVLASVNGVAAGAGANLAYACDLTFAAESAVFVQSFIHIGLIPDSGGTFTLPRLVGMQQAFGQMILAEKLSAAKAAGMGMIWKAVPDAELEDEVMTVAKKLATMPTLAIALTKYALNRSQGSNLEQHLLVEAELQAIAGRSKDSKEGVAAFLEKRKATFIGH